MDWNAASSDVSQDGANPVGIEAREVREQLKTAKAKLGDAAINLRDRTPWIPQAKAAESDELGRVCLHDAREIVIDPHRPVVCFATENFRAEGQTMTKHRYIDSQAIHRVELCVHVDDFGQ